MKTLSCRFTIGAMNGSKHAGIAALALLLTMFAAAAEERPHVTAEQVATAVAELDALAAKQNAVPGFAVAVVFQDKAVYAKGFGVRDVNGRAPVNADTVFQLASVSKPIGAAVVAAFIANDVGASTIPRTS